MQKEIHAVIVPFDEKNNSNNAKAIAELFTQAKQTLINRKKILQNKIFYNQILCFSSNKKGLHNLQNIIKDEYLILYVVGHHEYPGKIGISNCDKYDERDYFTPEIFANKIKNEFDITKIKEVQFYVCNSALSFDNKKSYCETFLHHIKNKNASICVGGFIGFLFEDRKKKKTYLTETYNNYKKLQKAEEKIIFFY